MLRQFATPTRQREPASPRLQRTISSATSGSGHRPSSPSLLRRLSSPSGFLKKLTNKEEMDPPLRQALNLLKLRDLDALEKYFLKTDAFLVPWTNFRDHFLLRQTSDMPHSAIPGQITRRDILHFYTYLCEGQLRYDPRGDPETKWYIPNCPNLGDIDKSGWCVVEYEKLLYVWLLQTFRVGKAVNPYHFQFFELRNICTAWEAVILPIVEAVRNDYNAISRYQYGRLAKCIEDASPSRLAFPEGNYTRRQQFLGRPRSSGNLPPPLPSLVGNTHPVTGFYGDVTDTLLSDDGETLRDVRPKYGQVVERARLGRPFLDWIKMQREQRALHNRQKALDNLEGVPTSPVESSPTEDGFSQEEKFVDLSAEKRLREAREAERKKRESPSGYMRKAHERDRSASLRSPTKGSGSRSVSHQRDNSAYSNLSTSTASPRPKAIRQGSDGVYSMIRSSNPFDEDPRLLYGHPSDRIYTPSGAPERKATIPIEIKPSPLEQASTGYGQTTPKVPNTGAKVVIRRKPSYEGTAFGSSPLPILKEVNTSEKVRATRIPSPIEIPPNESTRQYHPIIERAITTPLATEPPPSLPLKNPQRYNSVNGHVRSPIAARIAGENGHGLGARIISKENIRAALELDEDSDDSVADSVAPQMSPGDRVAFAFIGGRGMNTGESPKVQTFNRHMFPRPGTARSPDGDYGKGQTGEDSYEMKTLK